MSRSRRRGSFIRHRRSSRRMHPGVSAGRRSHCGSRSSTAAIMSATVAPGNGGAPVSISNSTHPNAHTSARRSTTAPRACSGLMYAAVPRISPVLVAGWLSVGDSQVGASLPAPPSPPPERGARPPSTWSVSLARPKSSSLTPPSGRTLTLAGLRSRWTTPFSCAASSASAIWRAIASASSSGSPPRSGSAPRRSLGAEPDGGRGTPEACPRAWWIRSASVGPSTSSSTSACTPPLSSRLWMAAMFGWLSEATTCASRWKRATRSGSLVNRSGRILSATSRCSLASRARYTSPMPPAPRLPITSYDPSRAPAFSSIRSHRPRGAGAASTAGLHCFSGAHLKKNSKPFIHSRGARGRPRRRPRRRDRPFRAVRHSQRAWSRGEPVSSAAAPVAGHSER